MSIIKPSEIGVIAAPTQRFSALEQQLMGILGFLEQQECMMNDH
jgi:hypothetical protein